MSWTKMVLDKNFEYNNHINFFKLSECVTKFKLNRKTYIQCASLN